MTRPHVEIEYLEPGIRFLLQNAAGPVAREVYRRGLRVESTAKRAAPVRTGRLRASLHTVLVPAGNAWQVEIRSNAYYAGYVERGTGLYGPYRQRITPRRGRYLVFTVNGRRIFARSVRGMRPRWYLRYAVAQEFGP